MKEKVSRLTLGYVAALIFLGVIGYFATGRQSVTALIPAFFGVVVWVVALILARSSNPTPYVWTMLIIGIVGIAATISGVPKAISMLTGETIARPAPAISQSIMAMISVAYAAIIALTCTRNKPSRRAAESS